MNSQNGWSLITSNSLDRSPFPDTNIVPVPGVRSGEVATILHYIGSQFNKNIERLFTPGCWGYAYKKIGSSETWSNHASGTAIDLNAPKHPQGKRDTFTPEQRSEIRKILSFLEGTVRWGGDYSYPDDMHFEINTTEADVKRVAEKIRGSANNSHADNLGKMLNWDYIVDEGNKVNYFNPKLEKLEKRGGQIVLATIRDLKQIIKDKDIEISKLKEQLPEGTQPPNSLPESPAQPPSAQPQPEEFIKIFSIFGINLYIKKEVR